MHTYAKFDQNIPCGLRVMGILLTGNEWTDIQTDTVIIVHTCGSCYCVSIESNSAYTELE